MHIKLASSSVSGAELTNPTQPNHSSGNEPPVSSGSDLSCGTEACQLQPSSKISRRNTISLLQEVFVYAGHHTTAEVPPLHALC